ncbi:MAG: hypothetical protein AB7G24_04320 [Novosphingobium sp.]
MDLAMQIDDLRESQKDSEESVNSLLDYIKINSRCDVPPDDFYRKLERNSYGIEEIGNETKLIGIGARFTLYFVDDVPSKLSIPGEYSVDLKCH